MPARRVTVVIDGGAAEAKSRLTHISLNLMTMRLMERWREAVGQILGEPPDYESTMIIGAVISIGAEKFIRSDVETNLETLKTPLPASALRPTNVSSVAAAAGLNRETTRRKLNELVKGGILTRDEYGFRLVDGLLQLPIVADTVRSQLEVLSRTINELGAMGVIRLRHNVNR